MTNRNTVQKQLIAESLCLLDHPTAEEVWLDIAERVPSVSKATVYRNLKQMVADGKARTIALDQGPLRYDGRQGSHVHFHCDSCGLILDIHGVEINWQNSPDLPEGSKITQPEIVLHGLCPACRAKEDQKETQ